MFCFEKVKGMILTLSKVILEVGVCAEVKLFPEKKTNNLLKRKGFGGASGEVGNYIAK